MSRSFSHSPSRQRMPSDVGTRPGAGSGSGGGREMVIHRVVRESGGSVIYPMLTRTNYGDWALVMRVNLQAQGLWEAIDPGNGDYRDDRMVLSAILHAVPPEMLSMLAVKNTAKDAWDTIKTLRMGVQRVREAKAQTLRKEFDAIKFKNGESMDDFAMRLIRCY